MGERLKIVTIGGGSSYTPEIVEGFIKRAHELPVGEITFVDIPEGEAKMTIVANLARRMVQKAGLDIAIETTLNRREALKGADFVTTQFRVGLLEARARDERIPLRYNCIGQETTGAGGFAKALRTIPVIMDICRDMREICPDAWLINFTNPSGIIAEAVLKHAPDIKSLGLCNVPIGMKMGIARLLNVETSRVEIDFAGLNHLVYGLHVYLDGVDILPKITEILAGGGSMTMKNIIDLGWEPDFIASLKMLPCPYHRYFYQGDKLLAEEMEMAKTLGTRAEQVKQVEAELFELYKDPNLSIKPPQLEKRGGAYYSDVACNVISSIYNNKGDIQAVNVRNGGAIADLPEHVAVEVSSVITKAGAKPLNMGHLPVAARGLVQVVKAYEELAVEAGITGNYGTALQALVLNPLVPSAAVAQQLLDDIIRENITFLPQFAKAAKERGLV